MAKGLYKGKVWDKYFGWRVAEREERAVEERELWCVVMVCSVEWCGLGVGKGQWESKTWEI